MKINFLLNIFLLIFIPRLNNSKGQNINLNKIFDINEKSNDNLNRMFNLTGIVFDILREIMYQNINTTDSEFRECIGNISLKYNKVDDVELSNLYEGSSKGFIDLSSFHNCINHKNKDNIYNFYTVYPILNHEKKLNIAKLNDFAFYNDSWILGFCLIDNLCSEASLKKIVIEVNKKFNEYNIEVFNEYYNNPEHFGVIDNLGTSDGLIDFSKFDNYLRLTSFLLLIIQIFFIIFKKIPEKLFGFFIKRRYLREIRNDPRKIGNLLNNSIFTKKIKIKIRECFSLSDNLDSFITNKKNDELFKNEDLTYIKGIKAIGAIFLIFGTTYIYFFNYPICISEAKERKDYLTTTRCLFLVVFWRIAPALLLSSSGFSLSYKFLNFLDKKLVSFLADNIDIKEIKEEKEDKEETEQFLENQEKTDDNFTEASKTDSSKNKAVAYSNNSNNDSSSRNNNDSESNSKSYYENTLGIKFYQNDIAQKTLNSMFGNQRINDSVVLQRVSTDKIPYSILFNFLFRQIHKVFCVFIGILLFKRFFPIFISITSRGAPLMNFLYTELIHKLNTGIGYFLYYQNFIDLFKKHEHDVLSNKKISLLQVFSIIICETNYFIIGSILIFVCYKNKLPLDYIILFSIVLLTIFKVIYNFSKSEINPGMFYFDSVYQQFCFNPIYNFSYFLIGLFYGIVNYVVQNDISKKEAFTKERPMVGIPIIISKACDYKKRRNLVNFILSLIFLFIFLIGFPYIFNRQFDDIITKDEPSIIFKLISSIDVDFFLYLFHYFMIACYISGRNMLFKFFNSNVWVQISKLYFWIILLTPIVNYYIIYKTETQINIGFFIVMIYSAICITNLYIISVALFVIIELPYKKLIKLYFNITSKISESDLDDIDDENNDMKYPLQKESVMTELSEKDLEIENDEDKEKEDKENEDKDD